MSKIVSVLIILSNFLVCSHTFAWDGPPPFIGAMLSNLAKPSDYVDASTSGFWNGYAPFDSRIRTNTVLGQSDVDVSQASSKLEITQFQNAAALGGSGVNVPTDLYALDLGFTYNHKSENKKDDWSLLTSFGSDSNVPFNSINELNFQATGMYHYVVDPLHSWFFFVNYALNRPFLPGIPLPGAGYLIIDPVNHTFLCLGVPLFFGWQFKPLWNLSLSYFIPFTFNALLDYHITPNLKLFANFQWYTQSWYRAFRSDNMNMIIFDQKRLTVGASQGLGENYFISIFGGFAFDQQLYEAHQQTLAPTSQFLPLSLVGQIELAKRF